MEKSKIVPIFFNQEKALWFILTMNQLVKKAFQDFPEVGIGYVEFVGTNHQQIDLQFLKNEKVIVCGATIGKTKNLGVKDCFFQTQLIAQLPETQLKFLHFTVQGELSLKNLLKNIS